MVLLVSSVALKGNAKRKSLANSSVVEENSTDPASPAMHLQHVLGRDATKKKSNNTIIFFGFCKGGHKGAWQENSSTTHPKTRVMQLVHPIPEELLPPGAKRLSTLKESMLKGDPFPKLHAKASETKHILLPVSAFLQEHTGKGIIDGGEDLASMVQLLQWSHEIDVVVDSNDGFQMKSGDAKKLEDLIYNYNIKLTKLCHSFHRRNIWLFNFVPKNHYLFHLAQLGRHMSPKLGWCYQGEDLMHRIKVLAMSSFHGTAPRQLGTKILAKYLVALDLTLSQAEL